jgi:hypothetical protein
MVILALPVVVAASVQLATRCWILAFLCGAGILPVMLLIGVAIWPPDSITNWHITLVLAILWGSITGSFGTVLSWGVLQIIEKRRKPVC